MCRYLLDSGIAHTVYSTSLCSTSESILDDGHALSSSQIYEYLSNVMYQKRSKFDPFWNAFLVGGVEKGEPCVDHSFLPFQPHDARARVFLL